MTKQVDIAAPTNPVELSTHRELELFRDLQRLANARHESEQSIAQTYRQVTEQAEQQFKQQSQQIEKQFAAARDSAQSLHDESLAAENERYDSLRTTTQQAYQENKQEIDTHYKRTVEGANAERKQTAWQTLSVFDASKDTPKLRLEERRGEIVEHEQEIAALESEAHEMLAMRNLAKVAEEQDALPGTAAADLPTAVSQVREVVNQLWEDKSTTWLEGAKPWLVGIGTTIVPIVGFAFALGWTNWLGYVIGFVVGVIVAGALVFVLGGRAKKAAAARMRKIRQALASAQLTVKLAHEAAINTSRSEAQQLIANRDNELAEIESRAKQKLAEVEAWHETAMQEVSTKFPAELSKMREQHRQTVAEIEQKLKSTLDQTTQHRDTQSTATSDARKSTLGKAEQTRDADWQRMHNDWFAGYYAIRDELQRMTDQSNSLTPDWREHSYADWNKPTESTPAIPFGESTLKLSNVKAALSEDQRLLPPETELKIPALLHLSEQPSMVVTTPAAQRGRAIGMLQSMLVRFITAMPPGKVRLTLCDPVGLGESFSAFMHLADYDENLIASRIWTQGRDIDEQLLRLTTHMETILQSYLRDEYESIHEYNQQAGEVAEPFQVLAIADFPHGMSDTSLKRLLSLMKGGPRCGIFVLLAVDVSQKISGDMQLDTFYEGAVHLDWRTKSNRFVWRYPAFERLPLALPEPLPADRLVALLKNAGRAAQDAIKVEVPFSVVAPHDDLWQQTCDSELRVPIGRAGANRLQYVRLGKGTSQHLLVAGKTGSGKSTFLHALVTSAALHFSPREVEFYLVDFKKGVEFKSYASQELAHAKVIAIESEREFGISVLERLDEILRERGEKFRAAGVQSLADYRSAHPDDPMPRVLLVVDEFQELFVEDDKLASQAGLLLDRLIRQGRAFGMHVVLGSQTLAGAYSLARATLGQMAVRVALQCSEADAHLILSDERNQAARFLSRPGEAIYNDQNGMVTANEPFQVVWLSDSERSGHLAHVRDETQSRELSTEPPIVFEGNAPSRPSENEELQAAISGEELPAPRIWLGAAVSIRPPVRADFHRSAGSNLLVVGQNDTIALGVLTTAALSLARGSGLQVDVIDGSRSEEPGAEQWPAIERAGGGKIRLTPPREAAKVIAELADELARRESAGEESAPRRFLLIYNAARARDLRKGDDDLGFSFTQEKAPASASKQFLELLKNGPSWGIHVLLWSDSYNSLTRLIDRVTLREFDYRVVMQMAGGDSSNLIDTPAATRLNEHRALLYTDETGESEKFRPYQVPDRDWLESLD